MFLRAISVKNRLLVVITLQFLLFYGWKKILYTTVLSINSVIMYNKKERVDLHLIYIRYILFFVFKNLYYFIFLANICDYYTYKELILIINN